MSFVSGSSAVMTLSEKIKSKVDKIVNFDLQNKNKFSKTELVVVEEAHVNMSVMFDSSSAKDFMAQEEELKNSLYKVILFIVNNFDE